MSLERILGVDLTDLSTRERNLTFILNVKNYGTVLKESTFEGHEDFLGLGTTERVQKCLKRKKKERERCETNLPLSKLGFLTAGNGIP